MSAAQGDNGDPAPAPLPPGKQPGLNDFLYGKIIGEGAFSTVYLVKHKTTGHMFAMKMCNKQEAIKKRIVDRLQRERKILSKLDHPLIPRLYCSFVTSEDAVFVLSLGHYGDMVPVLRRLGSFDMKCIQFYISELLLALEYLHKNRILHRDLKPENLLLKEDLHILLTDYGTAKDLNEAPSAAKSSDSEESISPDASPRRSSFVGSPQYVSPEVLKNEEVTEASDYFALGSIVYQFLAGEAPFLDENEWLMFEKVLHLDYSFPDGFPDVAADLVKKFLVLNSDDRLGSSAMGGCDEVKLHPFFEGVNFASLLEMKPPKLLPFLPASNSQEGNFYSEMEKCCIDESEAAFRNVRWIHNHMDLFKGEDNGDSSDEGVKGDGRGQSQGTVRRSSDLSFRISGLGAMSSEEHRKKMEHQKDTTAWSVFAKDRLIIKMGILDKRVGLFARRRMFLFLQGPIFLYIDPKNKEIKGEIQWCDSLTPEFKHDKLFFIHVPDRVYYLIDPEGKAQEWVDTINKVKLDVTQAQKLLNDLR